MEGKIFGLTFLLCWISWSDCLAQEDLYDYDHSHRFADYLMAAEEYKSAVQEYERLVFMRPSNDTLKLNLLCAYRKARRFNMGVQRYKEFPSEQWSSSEMQKQVAQEYTRLLLLNSDYSEAKIFIQEKLHERKTEYQLALLLLKKEWERAYELALSRKEGESPRLVLLAERGAHMKYKSKALAAGLSAVIPGLGKVYTGNWQDGAIAFLFVGANAFAAYRGFSRNGVNSAFGWIFAGLGTAYYAGNIYGSYKSAQRYNERNDNSLKHEVEDYLLLAD